MKRSASLPHIPLRAPNSKRRRLDLDSNNKHEEECCRKTSDNSSLLVLSDDLLLRILRTLLQCEKMKISVSSCRNLKYVISLASTCTRLQHLFFSSIREVDNTVIETDDDDDVRRYDFLSDDKDGDYMSRGQGGAGSSSSSSSIASKYVMYPIVIKLPILMQLVKKTNKSLRILKLTNMDINSTSIILNSLIDYKCFQVHNLHVSDSRSSNGHWNMFQSIQLMYNLKHLEVHKPSKHLLENLVFLNCHLKQLSLYMLNCKFSPHVVSFLNSTKSLILNSVTLYFHNHATFLPESFNFPKFNLHHVYPDVHLEISKGIVDVLNFIAANKFRRLPLLHTLNIQTVGCDINQEPCDLVNCPAPFKHLDPLAGTVKLIRNATLPAGSAVTSLPSSLEDGGTADNENETVNASRSSTSLSSISLRTDHPLLHESLKALSPLLSRNTLFTLHVHDLSMTVPPIKADPLCISKLTSDLQTLAQSPSYSTSSSLPPSSSSEELLHHTVLSIKLESFVHGEAPNFIKYTNFSKLKLLDISSINFCIEYGRNIHAHRPKLIRLLKQSEASLKIIRITTFFKNNSINQEGNIIHAKNYLIDILSYSIRVRILELSDEFLITSLYDYKKENVSDIFIHMSNFHIIRFGSLNSSHSCNIIHDHLASSNYGCPRNIINNFYVKLFHVLPTLLNLVKNYCPKLKTLLLMSMYRAEKSHHLRMNSLLRKSIRALADLERQLPDLDASTVRTQLQLWSSKGRLR